MPAIGVLGGPPVSTGRNELGLDEGTEMIWAIGSIRGTALHAHGRDHVVAAPGVGCQVGRAVGQPSFRWPQVVMGIDDGADWIDDWFSDLVEPRLVASGNRVVRHLLVLAR
jgi:hypothetical protein